MYEGVGSYSSIILVYPYLSLKRSLTFRILLTFFPFNIFVVIFVVIFLGSTLGDDSLQGTRNRHER